MKREFYVEEIKKTFPRSKVLSLLIGAALLSFGMYNIHQQVEITEGGIFGLNLLLNHWFGLSVSLIAPILDFTCYMLAFAYLGKKFLYLSVFSSIAFAVLYRIWEMFPPLLPNLSAFPITAAIIGGLFVGLGVGMIVRAGGSSGGDDALALIMSGKTRLKLQYSYLLSDIVVLIMSLSYISPTKIIYSVITVIVSSNVIGWLQHSKAVLQNNRNVLQLPEKFNYGDYF